MELTEKEKKARDYICVALDMVEKDEILDVVDDLKDVVGYFKLNSAFTRYGPGLIHDIREMGGKVFLDLKYHDIPNTLSHYADACTRIGVSIFNMHCAGGTEMMKAAVKQAKQTAAEIDMPVPKMIGITVMTSINKDTLYNEMFVLGEVEEAVLRWANLAKQSGLNGIVCSAQDLAKIKKELPDNFFYITPGIRPAGVSHDDQKRVMTPSRAVQEGSSLLVIGRAILKAADRKEAAMEILKDIAKVL